MPLRLISAILTSSKVLEDAHFPCLKENLEKEKKINSRKGTIIYKWKTRNRQGAGPANVLFWGTLARDPELVGFVYRVNKAWGQLGCSHSTALRGWQGRQVLNNFVQECLFFLGKKWLPACLGGGCFPVQCFFPRKRLLYQAFNFTWRAENNIQPIRLKFSIHSWIHCERSGPCSYKFCPKSCRQTYNRLMIVFSSLSFLLPALLPLASFSSSSVWSFFCEMIPLGK